MKRFTNRVFSMTGIGLALFALTLLSTGCADCSESYGNDDSQSSDHKQSSDKKSSDSSGSDDSKTDDDDDTEEYGIIEDAEDIEEELALLEEGRCPTAAYAACDGATRKYCKTTDNGKKGKIVTEDCKDACENGKCVSFSANSCEEPYVVNVGKKVAGKTQTGKTYSNLGTCSDKMKTMMGVFKLVVPALGFYKINIESDSTVNWGNILAYDCKPEHELTSGCELADKKDSFATMLSAGDYYLFVAPASFLANHFKATVSLNQVTYAEAQICGIYQGEMIPVEFKDNVFQITGSTSTGISGEHWDTVKGCNGYGNGGKENAYVFSVTKEKEFDIELKVKSTDDLPGRIAVYIKKCKEGVANLTSCVDDNGTAEKLTDKVKLGVGQYVVYVDSDGKTFDYQLTIK